MMANTITVRAKKINIEKNNTIEVPSNQLSDNLFNNPQIDTQSSGNNAVLQPEYRKLGKNSISYYFEDLELDDFSDINNKSQLQFINSSLLKNIHLKRDHSFSNSFGNSIQLQARRENSLITSYGSQKNKEIGLNFFKKSFLNFSLHISNRENEGISQVKGNNLENDSFQSFNTFLTVSKKINNFNIGSKILLIDGKQEIDGFNFLSNMPIDQVKNDQSSYQNFNLSNFIEWQKTKQYKISFKHQFSETQRDIQSFSSKSKSNLFGLKSKFLISKLLNFSLHSNFSMNEIILDNEIYKQNYFTMTAQNSLFINNFLITPFLKYQCFRNTQIPFGVNIKKILSKKSNLTLNASKENNLPSIYQLFGVLNLSTPQIIGNKNLKGEKIYKFDIDYEYKSDLLNFSVNPFYYSLRDRIIFDTIYKNRDKSKNYGLEFNLSKSNNKLFTPSFSYRYLKIKEKSNNIIYSPKHKFNFNISSQIKALENNLNISFIDSRESERGSTLKSYFLLNYYSNLHINKSILIGLHIHNLLNKNYEEIEFYQTRGRSFYGTIKYRF